MKAFSTLLVATATTAMTIDNEAAVMQTCVDDPVMVLFCHEFDVVVDLEYERARPCEDYEYNLCGDSDSDDGECSCCDSDNESDTPVPQNDEELRDYIMSASCLEIGYVWFVAAEADEENIVPAALREFGFMASDQTVDAFLDQLGYCYYTLMDAAPTVEQIENDSCVKLWAFADGVIDIAGTDIDPEDAGEIMCEFGFCTQFIALADRLLNDCAPDDSAPEDSDNGSESGPVPDLPQNDDEYRDLIDEANCVQIGFLWFFGLEQDGDNLVPNAMRDFGFMPSDSTVQAFHDNLDDCTLNMVTHAPPAAYVETMPCEAIYDFAENVIGLVGDDVDLAVIEMVMGEWGLSAQYQAVVARIEGDCAFD